MWGYSNKDEILGRSLFDFFAGENVHKTITELRKDRGRVGDDIGKRKDGSTFHTQFSASLVRDNEGTPLYMFGSFVDITERKLAEASLKQAKKELMLKINEATKELRAANRKLEKEIVERKQAMDEVRKSEADYRGLFESAHDAIVIFEPKNEIVLDVNHRACEIYGFNHSEFIGMSLEKISKNNPRGKRHITKTFDKGFCHQFETTQYRKDDSEMILEINASPVDYKGQQAILSINRDVTDQRRAQQNLKNAHELLMTKHRALEEKNIALNEVLNHIEFEKRSIESKIQTQIDQIILPAMKALQRKLGSTERKYLLLLEDSLEDITSSITHHLSDQYTALSPRELQICNMIKQGLSSKETAALLNISEETIRSQRKNIRKKLGISGQKINLSSFLTLMDTQRSHPA
jgi:PAS domain S-box-containing protein